MQSIWCELPYLQVTFLFIFKQLLLRSLCYADDGECNVAELLLILLTTVTGVYWWVEDMGRWGVVLKMWNSAIFDKIFTRVIPFLVWVPFKVWGRYRVPHHWEWWGSCPLCPPSLGLRFHSQNIKYIMCMHPSVICRECGGILPFSLFFGKRN